MTIKGSGSGSIPLTNGSGSATLQETVTYIKEGSGI
jgi:hypothetical protein